MRQRRQAWRRISELVGFGRETVVVINQAGMGTACEARRACFPVGRDDQDGCWLCRQQMLNVLQKIFNVANNVDVNVAKILNLIVCYYKNIKEYM